MDDAQGRVEFGLLERLSDLLICSHCLRRGVKTPITQVISRRHRPRSLCRDCGATLDRHAGRSRPVRVLWAITRG